jgi:hypothetical protein
VIARENSNDRPLDRVALAMRPFQCKVVIVGNNHIFFEDKVQRLFTTTYFHTYVSLYAIYKTYATILNTPLLMIYDLLLHLPIYFHVFLYTKCIFGKKDFVSFLPALFSG